jgi:ribosomal protein S18 acetylase RimI-like enzyme
MWWIVIAFIVNRLPQHLAGQQHGAVVLIRELAPDDWQALRDIRLTALRDAPSAFGSTYASFGEPEWRGRLRPESATFLAHLPEVSPAGLAGVIGEDPGTAELVSMWVAPAARGRGVGEALVTAAAEWAKGRDYREVHLWVTESNAHAQALYERCGFTPTGERQPLPSDPSVLEIGMRRLVLG